MKKKFRIITQWIEATIEMIYEFGILGLKTPIGFGDSYLWDPKSW